MSNVFGFGFAFGFRLSPLHSLSSRRFVLCSDGLLIIILYCEREKDAASFYALLIYIYLVWWGPFSNNFRFR